MAAFNLTPSGSSTFILTGIIGLETAHIWISIPFFVCYIIGLMGNVMLLLVVGKEETLHKPMYLLLCMLALTDIVTSSSIVPRALCIFWFNLKGISVDGCLTQMFFLHAVSVMQSAILVTMAFDRYVAICIPLRYTTILSNSRIAKLGIVGLVRAILFILPLPLLLNRLPFCDNHIIPHIYCDHMAVAKLSCGDITFNKTYGLVIAFVVIGLDLMLVVLSYGLIIRAILRLSSRNAYQKAVNTCTTHLCVMLMSCVLLLFSSMTHRFGQNTAPHIHIILATLYFLVPPMFNPIIYGVKTKELRDKVGKYMCRG
ncbi:olfactory receptor 52N4-like [Pelodiscus sinensis]|uniref:olfactory receptor 52N4-like n=1 Tax=Pelodiscus sinensis TaxID=13735 RepID=UPI0003C429BB|nr:olfactory receptor 52N4-like [Pelodiscus sinensis]|eukprot:XP_025038801.1 olfactory receptor 52N4-like [Pelodiscus sinensis]